MFSKGLNVELIEPLKIMEVLKKQYLIAFFFCISPCFLNSQNLIKNGGFEEYSILPTSVSQIHLAHHWMHLSVTSDFFVMPDFFNIPPHSGNAYAGFGLWVSNAPVYTAESFKQKLDKPLMSGHQYYLKFYAATANWSQGNCANIEIHGTIDDPERLTGNLNYVGNFVATDLLGTSQFLADEAWRLVELCFVAPQDLEYLIISVSNSTCDQYFYVDDIELYELETEKFFEDEATLCTDVPLILGTEISNTSFQWQDGSSSPTFRVTEPGLHWWSVDTVCGLRLSDSIFIKDGRIELEDDFLGADSTLCQDEVMNLEVRAMDEALSFEWNTGSTEAMIEIYEAGQYEVLVQKEDCSISDMIDVNYITCADCIVNAPNIFSPNDDGINDEFRAVSNCPILSFSIKIFDRWGSIVFESQSIENTWNGKHKKNTSLNNALFVYVIEYEAEQYGETVSGTVSGDVMMIK